MARRHPGASPGPHVVLTVRDTGVGMDAGTLVRTFDPFSTTKSETSAAGLGLAAVLESTERSGGFVEVEGELEKGTALRVYLPRLEEGVNASAHTANVHTANVHTANVHNASPRAAGKP